MSDIKRIQERIRALYSTKSEQPLPLPLALEAVQWAQLAEDYIACASLVEEKLPAKWLPRLQLTGHALEAALKGCIAAADVAPPNSHDLVELYDLAAKNGYDLGGPHQAAIVHAGHFYYQDLATRTKYKARYPAKTTESVGGAVPPNSTFQSIAGALVAQARARRPW